MDPSGDLFRDRSVLITGASAGLGETFARRLAAHGAHLILTARRRDRLEALARELTAAHNIPVHVIEHDLATAGAAHGLFQKVQALGLEVDHLINNAGFGLYGPFVEQPIDRYEEMLRLNVETLTTASRLFLPGMIARRRGGIINVGSTASFQPVPGFTTYAATKAYVLSFSEGLREEVRPMGVRVLALCPGATRTEFQSHSGTAGMAPDWNFESAESVVDRGLRAYERALPVKVSGAANWAMTFAPRFFPRSWVASVAGSMLGRAKALAERKKKAG